ncbi:MAG TPA: hypothetical protein VKU39_03630 [Streptosporangiaceae bacterium]|nr:hypothetical protein [Streptosporangiaceae bacterium]
MHRHTLARVHRLAAAGALAAVGSLLTSGPAVVPLEITELAAGAVNVVMLALNFRDGRRLTAGRRTRRQTESLSPAGRMINTGV